jgi:hypothetical protein
VSAAVLAAGPGIVVPEVPPAMATTPATPMAPAATAAANADAARELTIDDLAAKSGVPSRTIRFYQSKGALPKPEIRGRVAFYGAEHVERLRLIEELQDRGLQIKAICDLVGRIDKGELVLGEWLGLDAQLREPWAHDAPRVVTEVELRELAGSKRPGAVAALLRVKLVERRGDAFVVKSPALLQTAMRLEAAGVDIETAAGGAAILRKHLQRAASDLADYFFDHAVEGFGRDATATSMRDVFEALRPTGLEAVRLIFGQEMGRVLRKLVESGKTAKIAKTRKKPKP